MPAGMTFPWEDLLKRTPSSREAGNSAAWDRYAYGLNNPSRYTDPDGHRPCELVCEGDIIDWNEAKKGSAWYGEWDVKKQKTNQKIAKTILEDGTELIASVLFEPADWAITARDCASGNCSPWMLAGLLPFIPSSAGKHLDDAIQLVPASTLHWSQEGVSWATRKEISCGFR